MTIETAETLVTALGLYAAAGLIIALLYAIFGAAKIDPAAKGMPLQARVIIMPGVALLWPVMLVKLFTQKAPPVS